MWGCEVLRHGPVSRDLIVEVIGFERFVQMVGKASQEQIGLHVIVKGGRKSDNGDFVIHFPYFLYSRVAIHDRHLYIQQDYVVFFAVEFDKRIHAIGYFIESYIPFF